MRFAFAGKIEAQRGRTSRALRAKAPTSDNGPNVAFAPALIARFWSHVQRGEPSACWLWTASCTGRRSTHQLATRPHGQFTYRPAPRQSQVHIYAHRFAWWVTHGPIPAGQQVLHRCDVPSCVNPAHLFLGTQADNMNDAARKGRLRRTA